MYSRDVFPDNAQREELSSGKNRNNRGEKWKARRGCALDKITCQNKTENQKSETRKSDSDKTS